MHKTFAFCLYKYFPYGGLQRDMLRIALACQARGHTVHVYTTDWQGDRPERLQVHIRRRQGLSSHSRMKHYHTWVTEELAQRPADCVIGFNKMPGLDVYFAADTCFQAKARESRSWLYRLGPRYRHYVAFEEAVFRADAKTHVLMLTEIQETSYLRYYETPADRIHRLPPNMARDRVADANALQTRHAFRQTQGLRDDDRLLLQVGSDFRRKGLDRSIRALASLPKTCLAGTRLYVVGVGTQRPYAKLARWLGVEENVVFLGPRDDVPQILVSADLLVHPAREEAGGIVLLEALAYGLPVVVSGICGHAHYIEQAGAGWILPHPFDQDTLNRTIQTALQRDDLRDIGRRGIAFARRVDLCGMVDAAVEVIEAIASRRSIE